MTNEQWQRFLSVVHNRDSFQLEPCLIVDSPFLPEVGGCSTLEYLTIQEKWMEANFKVFERFPDVIFLPGTWVEYGVATEPSALGTPLKWWKDSPVTAIHYLESAADAAKLSVPDPETNGLMPVVLQWQEYVLPLLQERGHDIKVVVARGPMAIASQVRGMTELLMDTKLEPEACKGLIELCTETAIVWLKAQLERHPNAEAIQLHDDVIGMIGPEDYETFGHPYLERIFAEFPEHLHIFHNDSPGIPFIPRFADAGMEVFNYSHMEDTAALDREIGDRVCLMGNVPPVEVLSSGTPEETAESAEALLDGFERGILLSAGGGVSPGTKLENIDALVEVAKKYSR